MEKAEPVKISEAIKEKILRLQLPPEMVLNLSELAESFGVSRTPIKEAMILLQSNEWVVSQGSRFIVTPLSLDRIKEITEIRYVMEVEANVWAMNRISAREMEKLKELDAEIMRLGSEATARQIVGMDLRFHQILFTATRNKQLARLLEKLLGHYLRFWLSIQCKVGVEDFFMETRRIIQAIEAKDEAQVRAASTHHIKHSVDEIMATFL